MKNNEKNIENVQVEGTKNIEVTSNGKNIIKKAVVGTVALCLVVGLAIGCNESKEGKGKGNVAPTKVTSTPTPKVTAKPTVTVKPIVTPVATVTPTVEPTITVTPTPVVEEKVLTVEKVEKIAKDVVKNNKELGLETNEEEVKAVLIIENLEILKEEIQNYNLEETLQLATKYTDKVATHNIINAKDSSKYVRVSELAYDGIEKDILSRLEDEYLNLNKKSISKKEYYDSYSRIVNFYIEREKFYFSKAGYGYEDLTCGGEFLAEKCIWPTFAMAYCSSANLTKEMAMDIKTIQTLIFDGSRYMEDIIYFNVDCTKEKVMTK